MNKGLLLPTETESSPRPQKQSANPLGSSCINFYPVPRVEKGHQKKKLWGLRSMIFKLFKFYPDVCVKELP